MRVLVTGSRTWTHPAHIQCALADLYRPGPIVVVHGAATRGADLIAARWVAEQRQAGNVDIHEERHPADWTRYGRQAGVLRNLAMVRSGADLCLAFIRGDSPGATHCARTAQAAGIETRIVRSDG